MNQIPLNKHQIENASLVDPPQGRRKLPKFVWACSKAALRPCRSLHSILPKSREAIAHPVHPSPTSLPQNAISGTVPATSQYNMQEIAAWIGGCTQWYVIQSRYRKYEIEFIRFLFWYNYINYLCHINNYTLTTQKKKQNRIMI